MQGVHTVTMSDKFITRIFVFRRVRPASLPVLGFAADGEGGFCRSFLIAEGRMRMDVRVDAGGAVSAGVTDVDTGDPYTLFLVEEVAGGFVGSVRADYERVLSDIAERCCEKEIFKLPQTKELIAYAREKFGDEPEYLWEKTPDNAILRRPDNRKWYAAILTVRRNRLGGEGEEKTEAVDLRADPTFIAERVDGKKFLPGYHMNKQHWFTVPLDGTVPSEELFRLLDESRTLALTPARRR